MVSELTRLPRPQGICTCLSGLLSFLPTSYIASVLCTCISMYIGCPFYKLKSDVHTFYVATCMHLNCNVYCRCW